MQCCSVFLQNNNIVMIGGSKKAEQLKLNLKSTLLFMKCTVTCYASFEVVVKVRSTPTFLFFKANICC